MLEGGGFQLTGCPCAVRALVRSPSSVVSGPWAGGRSRLSELRWTKWQVACPCLTSCSLLPACCFVPLLVTSYFLILDSHLSPPSARAMAASATGTISA